MTATPPTDQQLNAIDTHAAAATPGPWATYDDGTGLIDIAADLDDTGHGYRCRRYIGQLEAGQIDNDPQHQDWTEEQDRAQVAADAAYIAAMSPETARALVDEVRRLRAELAEEKAAHNPRLRCLLVKAAPDRDLYIGWSNVCEMPAGAWSRQTALEYGFPPSRLDRADATGTSSHIGDGAWDDNGFVAEQRGWLRRDRLGDYAVEYLHGDRQAAYALLEPFDDEPPAVPPAAAPAGA